MPNVHLLKIHPCYFKEVASGKKTFELRINDRDYKSGDTLRLREYDPESKEFTGRFVDAKAGYIWYSKNPFPPCEEYAIISLLDIGKHKPTIGDKIRIGVDSND
jgi:hypothetical protein